MALALAGLLVTVLSYLASALGAAQDARTRTQALDVARRVLQDVRIAWRDEGAFDRAFLPASPVPSGLTCALQVGGLVTDCASGAAGSSGTSAPPTRDVTVDVHRAEVRVRLALRVVRPRAVASGAAEGGEP